LYNIFMLLSLSLTNYRSWKKFNFDFSLKRNLIIGKNTSGKSNILEAIYFLVIGKSLRGKSSKECIKIGSLFAKIEATTATGIRMQAIISEDTVARYGFKKVFKVNNVIKSRCDFLGNLLAVHFSPADIRFIIGSPSRRRDVVNNILSQCSLSYRRAQISYDKAVFQKNKVLAKLKAGKPDTGELDGWSALQEKFGTLLQKEREVFIDFCNKDLRNIFPQLGSNEDFPRIVYKKNTISEIALRNIKGKEIASGVSLIGPHRDDYIFVKDGNLDLEGYGSRGEQRTAVLAMKICEKDYIKSVSGETPILLLDDIFSELDSFHRKNILGILGDCQSIITTAEKSLIPEDILKTATLYEI
jgi:DNA replication and repair protein RecF